MARTNNSAGGPFRFRVSDSLPVPLRGHLLRLRLVEGSPSMRDLQPGKHIRIVSPTGGAREASIVGHSATGGRATQERLETLRELDLVIASEDAGSNEERVAIGWSVTGPVG